MRSADSLSYSIDSTAYYPLATVRWITTAQESQETPRHHFPWTTVTTASLMLMAVLLAVWLIRRSAPEQITMPEAE